MPTRPIATPSQPRILGRPPVRRAVQLTSSTHKPPRISPPAPPRPSVTGSIACQTATACCRIRVVESGDRLHAEVEDQAARDEHERPDESHDGGGLHHDRRPVLHTAVERERENARTIPKITYVMR